MIDELRQQVKRYFLLQRISVALAKAGVLQALRQIDEANPLTWEFSAFSQNNEDGIIDYLTRRIQHPNRYFIEVGASNGVENNTTWLGIARKYSGLLIEGDEQSCKALDLLLRLGLCIGVNYRQLFVTKDSSHRIMELALWPNPDVFSLDIDGNDYHVVKSLLETGLRPKIFIVEFNSVYGPSKRMTIPYREEFAAATTGASSLYYGASISAWRTLFDQHKYKFITVDSNGVNAFFVDPNEFDRTYLKRIRGLEFQENFLQLQKFKIPWQEQFRLIEQEYFVAV